MSSATVTEAGQGVTLLRLGEGKQVYDLPQGSTLADLLRAAGIDLRTHEVMIDGLRIEDAIALRPGDIVSLSPRAADDAWRETVGMFRGDPIFGAIIEAGRALREAERDEARRETGREAS